MPQYRIWYKSYYREHSEFGHEDVEAPSRGDALRAFFLHRLEAPEVIEGYDGEPPETLADIVPERVQSWWEGDWLVAYRGIRASNLVACPSCEGRGEVSRRKATALSRRGQRRA